MGFPTISGSRKSRLTAVGIRCADHATPSIRKKLALTSPTCGGRSVSIVRLRTKAVEFSFSLFPHYFLCCCVMWPLVFTCKLSYTQLFN
jgi:hypothetical protein